MDDVLANHTVDEVAAWYGRLADLIEKQNTVVPSPLSPMFLRHWLAGKSSALRFVAPRHLQTSKYVTDVLKKHRAWFLTEEKFKGNWVGVVPRMQGKPPHAKWNWKMINLDSMHIESLVEIEYKIFTAHTPGDLDLFTSLRGFQLRSDVSVSAASVQNSTHAKVTFLTWTAKVTDKYDFDGAEHLTVPNPDHNNPSKVANPIAPKQKDVRVYHKNALRLIQGGKAWNYLLESQPWPIWDSAIMGPGQVDPSKKI